MEKFTIISKRDFRSALADVLHNDSPRCRILINNLNIGDADEGDSNNPSRIFEYRDEDGDNHVYWAEITIVERMESGSYDGLLEQCWKWWLALAIRHRELEDLAEE